MERNFVIATRKPNGEFNEAKAYGDNEHLEDLIINPLVEAFKRYQQLCREREKANGTGI